jgi:hypothetical protein
LAVTWALAADEPPPGVSTEETPFVGRPDLPPARVGRPDVPPVPTVSANPSEEPVLTMVHGPVPVTPPTLAIPFKKRVRPPVPESLILDARCRLIPDPDTGWFLLEFLDPMPAGFPSRMYVLPGRELELMEAQAAADSQVVFRLTGQTTSFLGTPYILPLSVAQEPPAHQASRAPKSRAQTPPERAPTVTTAPVSGDESERVRSVLIKDRPGRSVVAAVAAAAPADLELQGDSATSPPPAAPPAGDILIDRIVRIARAPDGQWMEAHFEADNTLQDRPVPLLPCRLLERAEAIEGKVRITGILRRYKGRTYLLLRKALAERDMGQL